MSDDDLHFRAVTMKTAHDFSSLRHEHAVFGNCSCMRWRMRHTEFSQAAPGERERVLDALVARGTPVGILAYLEGYPAERQQRSWPGMGSASMFRQAGFRDATPPGTRQRVMRNIVG